jgi:thiamine biosynthesis lipoprotein
VFFGDFVMITCRFIFCFFVLFLGLNQVVAAQWFSFETSSMTTRVDLEFWLEDQSAAINIKRQVFDEFSRVESKMSRYDLSSELSKVNKYAGKRPVAVSEELFNMLDQAKQVSVLSDGAFDISFASVGYLYDFRGAVKPDEQTILSKISSVNFQHVRLDRIDKTVSFSSPGVMVDLGGIAKGYAVDRAADILKLNAVEHARISAGGDMYLLGDKRGKPWVVAVKNPRDAQANVVALPLSNVAMSTSGDYERFFIDDSGERIHHILSPKTGRSVKGLRSVTVIGPDAMITDGLSTAIFVLGLQKGLALVQRLDGIDAILVDDSGRIHYSRGLMQPKASP